MRNHARSAWSPSGVYLCVGICASGSRRFARSCDSRRVEFPYTNGELQLSTKRVTTIHSFMHLSLLKGCFLVSTLCMTRRAARHRARRLLTCSTATLYIYNICRPCTPRRLAHALGSYIGRCGLVDGAARALVGSHKCQACTQRSGLGVCYRALYGDGNPGRMDHAAFHCMTQGVK